MSRRLAPKVLLTEGLRETLRTSGLDEQHLAKSFADWKTLEAQGREHYQFGRDVPGLGNPALRHVHVVPLFTEQAERAWNLAWRRHRERTSDRYLFYADGTPAHGYLLITLINDPGAHVVWRPENRPFVELLEKIADEYHHFGKTPD